MKRTVILVLAAAMLMGSARASFEVELPEEPDEELPADLFDEPESVPADGLDVAAPSAILIEKETGRVLFEKNADERLEPASVTKVMTILLIVEAAESGALSLDDVVTVSARAASMGGSQVFLREGEQMTARELLKCIVVSSANDAAVAMAEHLAGSEEAFAERMNDRARELGMTNTHFDNCTGLLDDREHLTTARDIAVMSRELIRHDWIKEYTTIWMDSIRGGTFGLSSTNKLVRFYPGATGLKTGYTSRAGHCIAATAERDGAEYIAVVLHCQSSADRFESARTLLSYAFGAYTLVRPELCEVLPPVRVRLGKTRWCQPEAPELPPVAVRKSEAPSVTVTAERVTEVDAPLRAGDVLGTVTVRVGDDIVSVTDITAPEDIDKVGWWDVTLRMVRAFFIGG